MFKIRIRKHVKRSIRNKAELAFIRLFPDLTLRYEPETFYLSNGTKYVPDFYCEESEAFIEIIGTRQAYYNNRHKYELFRREYFPLVMVVVRGGTASLFEEYKPLRLAQKKKEERMRHRAKRDWLCAKEVRQLLGLSPMELNWRIRRSGVVLEKQGGRFLYTDEAIHTIESCYIRGGAFTRGIGSRSRDTGMKSTTTQEATQ
jgi:hypothetical protein